jgi:uncharacterized protein YecT (DUF1311 family)
MTKSIILLTASIITLSLFSAPSMAKKTLESCQAKHQDTDLSRCLDSVKESVDRELQTWVNNHIFNMEEKAMETGRYSALNMFKRSQSNFITFRENNCRWHYLAVSPQRGANIAYKKCYVLTTKTRINELSKIK